MQPTPRLLGALAAILVAGIGTGSLIGKVPPMRQLASENWLPAQHRDHFAIRHNHRRPLPDQYPIETPEGRFEVEQLSERGLYSQARYAPIRYYVVPAEPAPTADPPAYSSTPFDAAGEAAEAPIAPTAELPPEATQADSAPAVASAGPRVIDVTAELAARRRGATQATPAQGS